MDETADMSEQRKIVVGMDGSAGAAAALAWAVEYAPLLDAEVIVVYSMDVTMAVPAPTVAAPPFVVDDALRSGMRDALHDWCAPLRDSGVTYRAELYEGNAVGAITQLATEEHADLIVVGRRGHGGFSELVLGSVPHSLSHHATVPVVIVPAPA
jgi:nucleotide-binding universal stress UspA family protein